MNELLIPSRPHLLAGVLMLAVLLLSACSGWGGSGRDNSGRDNARLAPAPAQSDVIPPSGDIHKRARLRLELAGAYFSQGRTDVALDELAQSLKLDPDYADAYNLRGLIYLRLNQFEASEQNFRRALSIDGKNSDVLHNYGYMLCQAGRYADAQQQFDAAMADPAYLEREKTQLVSGICQARAGKLTDAEATLRRVLQLNPSNPAAGYNLADVLHRQQRDTDARFYIRRINNSDQASAASLWLGIKIERVLGNDEAVTQLSGQLRRRFPDSPELVAYDSGKFEE